MNICEASKLFDKFMRSSKRLIIVHHADADGASAAALVIKAARKYRLPVHATITPEITPTITKEIYESIIREKGDSLISLDLPLHQNTTYLSELSKKFRFLAIDHHGDASLPPLDLDSYGITHFHSYFLGADKPSTYPVGKLTYDILDELGMAEGYSWLARVGIIGDHGEQDWKEFFQQHTSYYDEIKIIAETFNLVLYKQPENMECFNVLIKANLPLEVISDKNFTEIHDKLCGEVRRVVDDFEADYQVVNGVLVYQVKSDYPINSPAITIASNKHPEKTIISYQKVPGGYHLEARNMSGEFHVGKFMADFCKGLGYGGGHREIGGGFVYEKFYDILIKRLNSF